MLLSSSQPPYAQTIVQAKNLKTLFITARTTHPYIYIVSDLLLFVNALAAICSGTFPRASITEPSAGSIRRGASRGADQINEGPCEQECPHGRMDDYTARTAVKVG